MIFRSGIYNRSSRSRGGEIAGPEITRVSPEEERQADCASFSENALISFMRRAPYEIPKYSENIIYKIISCRNNFSFSIFVSFSIFICLEKKQNSYA